jgi:hypothetical protein
LNRNAGYAFCSYADRNFSAALAYSPRTNRFCAASNDSLAATSALSGVDSSAGGAAATWPEATQRQTLTMKALRSALMLMQARLDGITLIRIKIRSRKPALAGGAR